MSDNQQTDIQQDKTTLNRSGIDGDGNGIDDQLELEYKIEHKKWEGRRIIAIKSFYTSVVIAIIVILLGLVDGDLNSRVNTLSDFILWTIYGFISIVLVYMGTAAVFNIFQHMKVKK